VMSVYQDENKENIGAGGSVFGGGFRRCGGTSKADSTRAPLRDITNEAVSFVQADVFQIVVARVIARLFPLVGCHHLSQFGWSGSGPPFFYTQAFELTPSSAARPPTSRPLRRNPKARTRPAHAHNIELRSRPPSKHCSSDRPGKRAALKGAFSFAT
jgi:hypothetical protein